MFAGQKRKHSDEGPDLVQETLSLCRVPLYEHQIKVLRHILVSRSLIVNHALGTGKTLSAVASSVMLRRYFGVSLKVIVVSSPTLFGNFQKELVTFWFGKSASTDVEKFIDKVPGIECYRFLSLQKLVTLLSRHLVSLDECLLIIDEVHNIRTPITKRTGKRVTVLLEHASRAKRVLGLTGTLVVNRPSDVNNLYMLATGKTELKTRSVPAHWFRGYLSCFDADSLDAHFPRVEYIDKQFVMTPEYYNAYYEVQQNALREFSLVSFREGSNLKAFFNGVRRATNALHVEHNVSEKLSYVINVILDNQQPSVNPHRMGTIVYSQFLHNGIRIVERLLKQSGIASYGVITGKTKAETRTKLVRQYNNKEISVLLLSKAGSEGISTLETKSLILMEPHWNAAAEMQTVYRARRIFSHKALPDEARVVQVHRLYLVKPNEKHPDDTFPSIDSHLRSWQNEKLTAINTFMEQARQYSI